MKEVILTFDENDNPVIETKGFKGPACKAFTKDLEEALGTAVETTLKPEFKQVDTKHTNRAKVGAR